MKFYPTRIQHLADVAPEMVTVTEDGKYVVVLNSNQKVQPVMGEIMRLTGDWTIENRGELEPLNWERLPEVSK